MPLSGRITFKRPLEGCGKVQVPKMIRWQFKLEPDQVLRVGVIGSTLIIIVVIAIFLITFK